MSFGLHHHIQINTPPEKIYRALTTADGIRTWWTTDVKLEETVGGKALFGFGNHSTFFEMTVRELAPPELVRWDCTGGNSEEWIGTAQRFTIGRPDEAGLVDLRFSHTGWLSDQGCIDLCNTTWGYLMVNLKICLEEDRARPFFT